MKTMEAYRGLKDTVGLIDRLFCDGPAYGSDGAFASDYISHSSIWDYIPGSLRKVYAALMDEKSYDIKLKDGPFYVDGKVYDGGYNLMDRGVPEIWMTVKGKTSDEVCAVLAHELFENPNEPDHSVIERNRKVWQRSIGHYSAARVPLYLGRQTGAQTQEGQPAAQSKEYHLGNVLGSFGEEICRLIYPNDPEKEPNIVDRGIKTIKNYFEPTLAGNWEEVFQGRWKQRKAKETEERTETLKKYGKQGAEQEERKTPA